MSLDVIESYVVKGKMYVSTKFLCFYFFRTDKQIGRWKKDGLPIAKKPKEISARGDFYILEEVVKWVDINVNKTKSNNSKGSGLDGDFDLEDEEKLFNIYTSGNAHQKRKLLLRLDQNRLDNFKKIEEIVEKEAKNKEYDTKYALVDMVKKGQQELASMFISFLKTSMSVLSKDLENKEQDEIYHLLDRHFKKEIDKLVQYIKRDEDVIVTFDEVIQTIIEITLDRDIDQEDLIKHIKEIG